MDGVVICVVNVGEVPNTKAPVPVSSDTELAISEDVHEVVRDVLRHRVLLSFEAEAAGVDPDKVLGVLLELVPTA
jgi:MoxR-like ATPase